MHIYKEELFYFSEPSEEHGKIINSQKMQWTATSQCLIRIIWHLRSSVQGVNHFNKNGLEWWCRIVYYKLAGYIIVLKIK